MHRVGVVAVLATVALGAASCGGERSKPAEEAESAEAVSEGGAWQVSEETPGLLAQAGFSADSALVIARTRFPSAQPSGGEIEMEEGRLVYSLDLVIAGQDGITEVWIDAATGEIVSVEHENGDEQR